jgi:hypothetical protein
MARRSTKYRMAAINSRLMIAPGSQRFAFFIRGSAGLSKRAAGSEF